MPPAPSSLGGGGHARGEDDPVHPLVLDQPEVAHLGIRLIIGMAQTASRPAVRATSSIPRTTAVNNGFSTSGTTTARTMLVRLGRILRAT